MITEHLPVPFFKDLENDYGKNAAAIAKEYSKTSAHLCAALDRKNFLVSCRKFRVAPQFIEQENKSLHNNYRLRQIKWRFNMKVVNVLISEAHRSINQLNNKHDRLVVNLLQLIPAEIVDEFVKREKIKNEKKSTEKKTIREKKLTSLVKKQRGGLTQLNNMDKSRKNWIVNLTDREIPQAVLDTLALGPKFSYNNNRRNQGKGLVALAKIYRIDSVVANFEAKNHFEQENTKKDVRNKTVDTIKTFLASVNNGKNYSRDHEYDLISDELEKGVHETRMFLQQNQDLLIMEADKSNKSVIITKADYHRKMMQLLRDETVYSKINRDLSNTQQLKNNSMVKDWYKRGLISKQTTEWLTTENALAPKIYGLVKLHKPGNPLRPIVSCIDSPFYKMSKFLSDTLSKVVGKTKSFIRDSFHFRNFIKHQRIPQNYMLASLDVISLYTNIPLELIETVIEEYWDKIKHHTKLPKKDFLYALKICVTSTFFQYQEEFYKQISGVAMGGPVSAVVANLVMEYIEEKILASLKCNVTFYKRFVDDCITCFPKNLHVYILEHFNSFHPKIQFTMETEKEGALNFLDMTVDHLEDQKINTKWYQKATSSGRYMNYFSNVPFQWKTNVINNLFQRAYKLSDKQYRQDSMNKARILLLGNGYPPSLLDKMMKKCKYICEKEEDKISREKVDVGKVVKMPYIKGLSEKLKKCWKPYNFFPVFNNPNSNKRFFSKLKSTVPPEKTSGVVYKINCMNCDVAYIGHTKRYLGARIRSHKYDKKEKTALHKHSQEQQHEFNFKKPEVLVKENNSRARLYHEAIQIKRCSNSINFRTDTDVLSTAYNVFF